MSARTPKTAMIIGAGVVGVTTAYALARRGVDVTLIDFRDGAGDGTSFANGGQLSYLHTEALASDTIIKDMPGLAMGLNPAFRIKVSLDPDYVNWLLAFLRNCTASRHAENTRSALAIGLESRLEMQKLVQRYDLDFDYQVPGKMQLIYTPEVRRNVEAGMAVKGLDEDEQRLLTYGEACKLEPALTDLGTRPEAVMYAAREALGDAHKFSVNLLALLKRDFGVKTLFGHRVQHVSLSSDRATLTLADGDVREADLCVLCTGADRRLLKELKIDAPVMPMKGYSMTAPHGENAPRISITDSKRRLVVSRLGDRIRIAGMADLGWTNPDPDQKRIATLLREAEASLPKAADFRNVQSVWAGLRPMTPDSNPRMGRPHAALAYNLGHGMLGWTMGMGTAERLAKLIGLPELVEI